VYERERERERERSACAFMCGCTRERYACYNIYNNTIIINILNIYTPNMNATSNRGDNTVCTMRDEHCVRAYTDVNGAIDAILYDYICVI